jgi:hypothetical protein
MGVTLMTTTGTEADVRAALGLQPSEGTQEPSGEPIVSATSDDAPVVTDTPQTPPAALAESPEDSTPDSPQAQGAQTKGRLQKRIDELVAARYHTQGELDAAKQQIAKLEAQLQSATPAPAKVLVPPTEGAPKEADFDTYDAYLAAVARDEARQEFDRRYQAKQAEDDQKRAQTAEESRRAALHDRIAAFVTDHPDYEEVISNPDLPALTPVMTHYLTKPTNALGPAMAYALAKDPSRFKAMAKMDPDDAAEAFGVLRAELSGNGSKPAPTLTKTPAAPPPPTPVRGASVSATLSLEEMAKRITPGDASTSDWIARRNAEIAKRGTR